jgi:preprotein translocase subunit SecG
LPGQPGRRIKRVAKMEWEGVILVVHVLTAVVMIGFILLQQGKGAEMGASFGAGSSQTVFGAAGSVGFMTKFTSALAAIFFATSIGLAVFARQHVQTYGVVPETAAQAKKEVGDIPTAPVRSTTSAAGTDIPVAPAK